MMDLIEYDNENGHCTYEAETTCRKCLIDGVALVTIGGTPSTWHAEGDEQNDVDYTPCDECGGRDFLPGERDLLAAARAEDAR